MSYIITYILMSYVPKKSRYKDWQGTPLLVSGLSFASVVCLCTYSTFKTHSTIPTLVMFFAGKLFISLVSEVFMECS